MRDRVDRWLASLGGWILPPRCLLCGARGQPPALDLCRDCMATLPVAPEPRQAGPSPLRWSLVPFAYGYPLDHLVHALKYRGQLAAGRVLGTVLAERLAAWPAALDVNAILPVPLHPHRHAERGFNQSTEIARAVARRLGRRLDERLARRQRDTQPQVGLHLAGRRDNLAGAFAAADCRGLRVAVVDDVTTTGSTLQALAEALHAAGAASVDAWCVARAEDPRIHAGPAPEASPGSRRIR